MHVHTYVLWHALLVCGSEWAPPCVGTPLLRVITKTKPALRSCLKPVVNGLTGAMVQEFFQDPKFALVGLADKAGPPGKDQGVIDFVSRFPPKPLEPKALNNSLGAKNRVQCV